MEESNQKYIRVETYSLACLVAASTRKNTYKIEEAIKRMIGPSEFVDINRDDITAFLHLTLKKHRSASMRDIMILLPDPKKSSISEYLSVISEEQKNQDNNKKRKSRTIN